MGEETIAQYKRSDEVNRYMKSLEQGAATTVWEAVSRDWEGKGGKYFEDCQVVMPVQEGWSPLDRGYTEHAYDQELEEKLWIDSLKLVGLGDDL